MTTLSEGAPRRLKRTKPPAGTAKVPVDEQKTYEFYKPLILTCILKLKNEKDKLNYSSWLTRLDGEQPDRMRNYIVVALFVSIKSHRPLHIFTAPPPKDLSELNIIQFEHLMEYIKKLQEDTNALSATKEIPKQENAERLAAVATDMCSYTATKTSQYMVQSFYARSDFSMCSWHNPTKILLPNNRDHNEWELYLNRLYSMKPNNDTTGKNKNQDPCEIMKINQVTKNISFSFRWHPLSVLYNNEIRPQKSPCFLVVDQDILNQPFNQQQIDEAAIAIVHGKSFPGYKMLNPRSYSTALMPDPKFVYQTTGVKIIYNNKLLTLDDKPKDKPCPLARRACCPPKRAEKSPPTASGACAEKTPPKSDGGCTGKTPPKSDDGGCGTGKTPPPPQSSTPICNRPTGKQCRKYPPREPETATGSTAQRPNKYGCCLSSIFDAVPGTECSELKSGKRCCVTAAAQNPPPRCNLDGGADRYDERLRRSADRNGPRRGGTPRAGNDRAATPAAARSNTADSPRPRTSSGHGRRENAASLWSSGGKCAVYSGRPRKNVALCSRMAVDPDSVYDDFSPVGPLSKMSNRTGARPAVLRDSSAPQPAPGGETPPRCRERLQSCHANAPVAADSSSRGPRQRSSSAPCCPEPSSQSASGYGNGRGYRRRNDDDDDGTQDESYVERRGAAANNWEPDVDGYDDFVVNAASMSERIPPAAQPTAAAVAGYDDSDSSCSDWSVEVSMRPNPNDCVNDDNDDGGGSDGSSSLSTLTSSDDDDNDDDDDDVSFGSRDADEPQTSGPAVGWGPQTLNDYSYYHQTGTNVRWPPREDGRGNVLDFVPVSTDDWRDRSVNWPDDDGNESAAEYNARPELDRSLENHCVGRPRIEDTSMPDCGYAFSSSDDDDASAAECSRG